MWKTREAWLPLKLYHFQGDPLDAKAILSCMERPFALWTVTSNKCYMLGDPGRIRRKGSRAGKYPLACFWLGDGHYHFSNSFLIAKCIWEQQWNLCHHDQMITVPTRDSCGAQQAPGPYGNETSEMVLHSAGGRAPGGFCAGWDFFPNLPAADPSASSLLLSNWDAN